MTTQEIIDYYAGLLIMQYRALPNAVAHVQAWASKFLQDQIVSKVRDAFNLDTAIGEQLTRLGAYRGISRTLFGIVSGDYWSLVPYTDPSPGSYFGGTLYGDTPLSNWVQYSDINSVSASLTDTQMRALIKLQAAFQSAEITLGNIDLILYVFFGNYVNVIDNGNMTITYTHLTTDPDPNGIWPMVKLAKILPAPSGVSYTVVEI